MSQSKLIARATISSLGVLAYIALVSLILNNASQIFGTMNKGLLGPVAFLLLFVFSTLLTGGLILGKPIMLYLDGLKKEGLKLFIYTGISLFILLLLIFLILFWLR